MPNIEVNSRVTHRSLMNKSKDRLACQVLDLMDELDRERARREALLAKTHDIVGLSEYHGFCAQREHPEPADAFGAHITDGSIGRVGDREIGPGHVVLSEDRYRWLRRKAGLDVVPDASLPQVGSFHG